MDLKILSTVFTSVFIAELGDKTQLATMLFASDKDTSKLTVFLGAAAALIVTSAIGVAAGSVVSQYVSEKTLQYVAGVGFIGIGSLDLGESVKKNAMKRKKTLKRRMSTGGDTTSIIQRLSMANTSSG